MYKMLFLLKKTEDEKITEHFIDFTLKNISAVACKEVSAASVESNLLLEQKYIKFCELSASSKDEMDRMMNTTAGKALNKELMEFYQFLTIISVNYDNISK